MDVPLKNLLRKRSQQDLALLQDEVVDLLYSTEESSVFHGGTSIWRCYDGKRFSNDLDFYSLPKKNFKERLIENAKMRGLNVIKFRKTKNSVFSKISNGRTECSLELGLRKKNGVLGFYKKADGTTMNILVLTPEDLILEKARAFIGRKLIRDVYDVFFLLSKVDLEKVRKELLELVSKFEEPKDESNLKTIVYSGKVPSFKEMMKTINGRLK
jgi:predicted nucleotidyltransferase component of viral defense system